MSETLAVQEVGWDEKGDGGSGPYLRLKEKGQKVKIRFVGKPIKFEETFVNPNTKKEETSVRFAAVVLYRNLETKTTEVKGFKFGWSVYKELRKYNEDPEYGDPTQYDITIVRTEEKPQYYSVVASRHNSPITEEEQRLVLEANLDLEKMYLKEGAEPTDSGTPVEDGEFDPFSED